MSVVTSVITLRHHRAERARDRALGADHVVVEPADERAGLRPGEERDRHALDLVEQRDAQVVDQALADLGRVPPLDDAEPGVDQRDEHGDGGEHDDERAVARRDGRVEDGPEQQRREQADHARRSAMVTRKPRIGQR